MQNLLIVAAMSVSSRGLQNAAGDPNPSFSTPPALLSPHHEALHGAIGGSVQRTVKSSVMQAAQVTYQEVLLTIDLPVDVVERFPSQPPP